MSESIQKVVNNAQHIIYIENAGTGAYAKIVYENASELICGNVGKIEAKLPKNSFLRINRKTLVNLDKCQIIDNKSVVTKRGTFEFSRRRWRAYMGKI